LLSPFSTQGSTRAAEIKCTSPDGKFAFRMARAEEKMSIIDKKSQKVVQPSQVHSVGHSS
jgi:hypothetical protein